MQQVSVSSPMEVICTDANLILQPLQKGENNVWVSRSTGKFEVRPAWDLAGQDNPECLGIVWGLVGKLKIHQDLPQRLVLIRQCERFAELPGRGSERHGVYKVQNVICVPISTEAAAVANLGLKPCPKHQQHTTNLPGPEIFTPGDLNNAPQQPLHHHQHHQSDVFAKIGGSLKTLASDTMKQAGRQAGNAAAFASQVKAQIGSKNSDALTPSNPPFVPSTGLTSKALLRFERRILDEFVKMYNDSDSFYFSLTGDVTNSLQRQMTAGKAKRGADNNGSSDSARLSIEKDGFPEAPWRSADDRFFFNRHLLQDLIDLGDSRADPFILPIVQGYAELMHAPLDLQDSDGFYSEFAGGSSGGGGPMLAMRSGSDNSHRLPDFYTVAVVSRRSRHRAGTRYKRRGVDADGHVANYVESEQNLVQCL